MLNNFSFSKLNSIKLVTSGKLQHITTKPSWKNTGLYTVAPKSTGTVDRSRLLTMPIQPVAGFSRLAISKAQNALGVATKNSFNNAASLLSVQVNTLGTNSRIKNTFKPVTIAVPAATGIDNLAIHGISRSFLMTTRESNDIRFFLCVDDLSTTLTPTDLGTVGVDVDKTICGLVMNENGTGGYGLSQMGDLLYNISADYIGSFMVGSSQSYSKKVSLERKTFSDNSSFVVIYKMDSGGKLNVVFCNPDLGVSHVAFGPTVEGVPEIAFADVRMVYVSELDGRLYIVANNTLHILNKTISNRYTPWKTYSLTTQFPDLDVPFTDLMSSGHDTQFMYPEYPEMALVQNADRSFSTITLTLTGTDPTAGGTRNITYSNTVCHDATSTYYKMFVPAQHYPDIGKRAFINTGEVNTKDYTLLSDSTLTDTSVSWSDIKDKPLSTVSDIDDAVAKRHMHLNLAYLNKITEDTSGQFLYNGAPPMVPLVADW